MFTRLRDLWDRISIALFRMRYSEKRFHRLTADLERRRESLRTKESAGPTGWASEAEIHQFMKTMQKVDWAVVGHLAGYYWKFFKLNSDVAYDQAVRTLHWSRRDDREWSAWARQQMEKAMLWIDQEGPEALRWGRECFRLVSEGRSVKAPSTLQ
jgi:hypothetical protein